MAVPPSFWPLSDLDLGSEKFTSKFQIYKKQTTDFYNKTLVSYREEKLFLPLGLSLIGGGAGMSTEKRWISQTDKSYLLKKSDIAVFSVFFFFSVQNKTEIVTPEHSAVGAVSHGQLMQWWGHRATGLREDPCFPSHFL